MKLGSVYIDINNTWLNPTKIRRITIIGSKKMLLFDEMDLVNTIKIYNKYAEYPKVQEFDKKFFKSKALIYEGKNFSPKINIAIMAAIIGIKCKKTPDLFAPIKEIPLIQQIKDANPGNRTT